MGLRQHADLTADGDACVRVGLVGQRALLDPPDRLDLPFEPALARLGLLRDFLGVAAQFVVPGRLFGAVSLVLRPLDVGLQASAVFLLRLKVEQQRPPAVRLLLAVGGVSALVVLRFLVDAVELDDPRDRPVEQRSVVGDEQDRAGEPA
ncbi:MAG TPA: hypothetical protein VGZ32_02475 [Actinocrinis sp.]|jgi:hypothetical protein|uniref:hypothetical protein n=1 Tax=Actinocrinis sp. TaxID=1920516 RepID=UPI002DDD6F40|nr:hypothetical protein [Actinocrinis sp.]HEV3169172.1 hypothetical protein [Actinocrinis sp.]